MDDSDVHHLIIGLNRENIEAILRGDVCMLPSDFLPNLTHESDVVVIFAETDDELGKRFPPALRPT